MILDKFYIQGFHFMWYIIAISTTIKGTELIQQFLFQDTVFIN